MTYAMTKEKLPESQRPSVLVVYSKPSCVQCTATIRALDKKDVDYVYMDVSEDEAALQAIKELGYLQAPVVVGTSGAHWSGFRPDLIDKELKAAVLA